MELVLPLEKMSVQDKLAAMEQLWTDLCRTPGDVPSPAWHDTELEARAQKVREGSARFTDWPAAKDAIRADCK